MIHALILLNADRGEYSPTNHTNEEVSKIFKIGMRTIDRVKKRFVEEELESELRMATTSRMYDKHFGGDIETRLVALV